MIRIRSLTLVQRLSAKEVIRVKYDFKNDSNEKLSVYAIPPVIDEMQASSKNNPNKTFHKHRVLKSYTNSNQGEFDHNYDQTELFKLKVIKA